VIVFGIRFKIALGGAIFAGVWAEARETLQRTFSSFLFVALETVGFLLSALALFDGAKKSEAKSAAMMTMLLRRIADSCLVIPIHYSHSIVAGGLEVISSVTRFTSRTSLVMRLEILARTSYGILDQSAVIASSLDTGRSTIG
jgi:hypothetical protein